MRARAAARGRTRARLVAAASSRIRASPEPLSLVEIAAASGVSRATVYRHFPSVSELIEAVAADLLARARFDQLLAAVDMPDPVEALRRVTIAGTAIWALDTSLVRNLIALLGSQAEAVSVIDQLEVGRAQVMQQIVERLDRAGRLRGGLSQAEAVDLLLVATEFAGWDRLVSGRQRSPAEATAAVVTLAVHAVVPDL